MYAIVCILVMDDLWNCLPQKKNVSSFREGSQTPAKTHENCDLQVFFYKISFKTYLPLKPPQHIPTYPNNIVRAQGGYGASSAVAATAGAATAGTWVANGCNAEDSHGLSMGPSAQIDKCQIM